MHLDPLWITAAATALYGFASTWLAFHIWRDRVQRERHFNNEMAERKLNDLRTAFYEASGYWRAHYYEGVTRDSPQIGRQFEAITRLESQLWLNGYRKEANDLGLAIRTNFDDVIKVLGRVGVALNLTPSEYRDVKAMGFGTPAA